MCKVRGDSRLMRSRTVLQVLSGQSIFERDDVEISPDSRNAIMAKFQRHSSIYNAFTRRA